MTLFLSLLSTIDWWTLACVLWWGLCFSTTCAQGFMVQWYHLSCDQANLLLPKGQFDICLRFTKKKWNYHVLTILRFNMIIFTLKRNSLTTKRENDHIILFVICHFRLYLCNSLWVLQQCNLSKEREKMKHEQMTQYSCDTLTSACITSTDTLNNLDLKKKIVISGSFMRRFRGFTELRHRRRQLNALTYIFSERRGGILILSVMCFSRVAA